MTNAGTRAAGADRVAACTVTTVTSADGTTISYRTVGTGPGLLVIPGSLTDAADLAGFAGELGRYFTVHTMDRRGRGGSGPQGAGYGIAAECADVAAVRAATGADLLFGHSFGGFVALEHAGTDPSVAGVVVYEPGVSIGGSVRMGWAPATTADLASGRHLDAFVHFARGVDPGATGRIPHRLLRVILLMAMRRRDREHKYALLPGTIREHTEAARLDNTHHRYREIGAPVLLMVGGRTNRATRAGDVAAELATVLRRARISTLPDMDHFGPMKHSRRVAIEAARFLLGTATPRA